MPFAIKKSHKILAITFLVIYFLYLVVSNFPAKYAASIIHAAAPNVYLNSVTGTVWDGVSHQAQVNISRKPVALGTVTWKVKILPLLMLKACVEFKASAPNQMFSGLACKAATASVTLKDTEFDFPVSIVGNSFGVPASGQMSGQVEKLSADVKNNKFVIKQLNARASWQNAKIYVDNIWYGLGSLAADAKHSGKGLIDYKLFDISGPYGLEATGQWSANKGLTVNGVLTPRPNSNQQVISALSTLYDQNQDGAYIVKWPL